MKLSVIVVSYNMCDLLRQSLLTLNRACHEINSELIVVDDASTDRSMAMLKEEFAEAKVIANTERIGIARSRNQGLDVATGEYVLLVNADTIISKKTVEQVLEFMDSHKDAGTVGVRMLSPQGRFLSESRTGFTKPWSTLLKLTGLAKYFPKSRLYKNNDNWMREEEFAITEVDVVNGAFMALRRQAVKQVDGIDERFVMFGHDIDLSLRIRLAGYKNYYYPRTYILNFNKQSAPKITWEYIKHFYGAMVIFAAKYLFKMPQLKLPGVPQLFTPKYEVER
ncbi:glycosyltransferase family 2 protein [Mucilaginibacter litoreus]|uniref:Glycosyltransferase family 2 protein n=1 Tax=Mucilaginibacter litoreus TaxID=1048221 RepID=A0ABW3ASV7_9SPHI